jgi:hypothetical protein
LDFIGGCVGRLHLSNRIGKKKEGCRRKEERGRGITVARKEEAERIKAKTPQSYERGVFWIKA